MKALKPPREKEMKMLPPWPREDFKTTDPRFRSTTYPATDGTPMTIHYIPMPPFEKKEEL
jgi:hypothetical protein